MREPSRGCTIFRTFSGWKTKGGPMKYCIEKQGAGISIRIDDIAGEERTVLQAIRQCRHSAWACQSGECLNIATMEEHTGDGSVILTLIPRPGGKINPSGIEACLRYMLHKAVKA